MTPDRTISVRQLAGGNPLVLEVTVRDRGSETHHRVTLAKADCEQLTGGHYTAEQCVEAAFRFLLDREPKESVLGRFELTVISRFFPEFERELPRYLAEVE